MRRLRATMSSPHRSQTRAVQSASPRAPAHRPPGSIPPHPRPRSNMGPEHQARNPFVPNKPRDFCNCFLCTIDEYLFIPQLGARSPPRRAPPAHARWQGPCHGPAVNGFFQKVVVWKTQVFSKNRGFGRSSVSLQDAPRRAIGASPGGWVVRGSPTRHKRSWCAAARWMFANRNRKALEGSPKDADPEVSGLRPGDTASPLHSGHGASIPQTPPLRGPGHPPHRTLPCGRLDVRLQHGPGHPRRGAANYKM